MGRPSGEASSLRLLSSSRVVSSRRAEAPPSGLPMCRPGRAGGGGGLVRKEVLFLSLWEGRTGGSVRFASEGGNTLRGQRKPDCAAFLREIALQLLFAFSANGGGMAFPPEPVDGFLSCLFRSWAYGTLEARGNGGDRGFSNVMIARLATVVPLLTSSDNGRALLSRRAGVRFVDPLNI